MSKIRREKYHLAGVEEIKEQARGLMREHSTAGISIRAIARQMDIAPSGIYYYFKNLHDLTTALIIDAFNHLATTLENAADETQHRSTLARIITVAAAYRAWALEHPVDFQLIYGNPIPKYSQPTELTYPPARRSFALLAGLFAQALENGELDPVPEYTHRPPEIDTALHLLTEQEGHDLPHTALYLTAIYWAHMHGLVTLELFNLIQPVIGDTEAFYRFETEIRLRHMGFKEERISS